MVQEVLAPGVQHGQDADFVRRGDADWRLVRSVSAAASNKRPYISRLFCKASAAIQWGA